MKISKDLLRQFGTHSGESRSEWEICNVGFRKMGEKRKQKDCLMILNTIACLSGFHYTPYPDSVFEHKIISFIPFIWLNFCKVASSDGGN